MRQVIRTDHAPNPVGPYSQAILVNDTLYCSGQVPIDPATNKLVTSGIVAETEQVMKNLEAVLSAAGMTFKNVAKCSIFMSNMVFYSSINAVYAKYFDNDTAPAREAVAVKTLPLNVNVEISLIAVL